MANSKSAGSIVCALAVICELKAPVIKVIFGLRDLVEVMVIWG